MQCVYVGLEAEQPCRSSVFYIVLGFTSVVMDESKFYEN